MRYVKLYMAAAMLALAGMYQTVNAALIPYPTPGVQNLVTYGFTATSTGDLLGYFAGTTASYDEDVGLSINGAAPLVYGLHNHLTTVGTAFNFGHVNAGDNLTFVLRVFNTGATYYSNPLLNSDGVNHVYSTLYTQGSGDDGIPASVPSGVYVAFEDLPNGGDFNYHDDTFVFINTTVVPEPGTLMAGLLLLLPLGVQGVRHLRNRKA